MERYRIVDFYDAEYPDILGYTETLEGARIIKKQRESDTDGECLVVITDRYTNKDVL